VTFPAVILPLKVYLNLSGTWTDISTYTYQRSLPSITRGRADETSSANPQTMTGQWNNRDGRFSPRNPTGPYYGSLVRNTPVRAGVVNSGAVYLRFADDSLSYCSCPDSTGLQITGDIDVRWFGRLDDHNACLLFSKFGTTGQAWALALNGDGTLTFTWNDGTSSHQVTSTAGLEVPYGQVLIRATLAHSTGTVTFYTGTSMGTGSQFGNTVVFGSTSVAAAAGQAVAAGYSYQYNQLYGVNGCLGEVYECRVYSGIAGTLEADPVFTSQTAGSASFTDSQSNTWTVNGTSELSDIVYRFHGECSALPQQWDPSGADVWTAVTASGMLRRIQQQQNPTVSSMTRALSQITDLVALWPCEDGASSTVLASAVPGVAGMTISGSPVLATSAAFLSTSPLPQVNKSVWHGNIPGYTATADTFAFLLDGIAADFGNSGVPVIAYCPAGTATSLEVELGSLGNIQANAIGAAGILATATSNLSTYAGTPCLVVVQVTASGGTCTLKLSVVAAGATSADTSTATYSGSIGPVSTVAVNPISTVTLTSSVVGEIAVTSGTLSAASLIAAVNAHQGETAGARFARLCSENSLGCRIYGYPVHSALMGPQTSATLPDLLQECETADMGLIFESRRALAIGYRTLGSLCSQTAGVVLNYSSAELGGTSQSGELTPTDDDQHTVNDVTVQRGSVSGPAGSTAQVVQETGDMSVNSPPDGVGDYSTQITANVGYDKQLPDVAGWLLHAGTIDQERYPVIPLNLARPELASPLLWEIAALDIGDYLQITNPPAWLPPQVIGQLCYGYAETAGGYFWDWLGNCVPEQAFQVLVAGTGSTSDPRADSSGSTLNSSATSTATSVTVAVAAGCQLWTVAGADFPLSIAVAGEEMTVTDVSWPPSDFLTGDTANFNGGTTGTWSAQSNTTIANVASPTHQGAGACKWTSTAAGNMQAAHCTAGNITSQGLACSPGDIIVMMAWFLAATTGRTVYLGAQFYTSGAVSIANANDIKDAVTDNTSTWTKVTGRVIAPALSAYCRLYPIVVGTGGASEVHYCDDMYIADLTSAGSLVQTFTVTRSVNGVVKAQSAGAAVDVWNPVALAVT
jgi:hypothetical protein